MCRCMSYRLYKNGSWRIKSDISANLGGIKVYLLLRRLIISTIVLISPNLFSHGEETHALINKSKADMQNQCVEPTDIMRKQHFIFLYHQRDKTVLKGIRTKQHSLANCIDCHVSYDEKGVAIPINSDGQFCQVCHIKTAVNIDCFTCHATVPRGRKSSMENENNFSKIETNSSMLIKYFAEHGNAK